MFAFVLWAWNDLAQPTSPSVMATGSTTVVSFPKRRVQPTLYGPVSYYSLGRVHPRARVREMFPYTTRRQFTPSSPLISRVIPVGVNFARLLRDDWIGPAGQAQLGMELATLLQQVPSLAPYAARIAAINWSDLQIASQQIRDVLIASGVTAFQIRAPRVMRELWPTGKMFSEELYCLFNSAK